MISPSAVCSCDPCLWKGCRTVPVCVLVCLDVGGNAVGWDYCGIYVLWKIPSPCFHGNPSISVNPGDSEQASNHSRSPRRCSLTWLKSTFVLHVFRKSSGTEWSQQKTQFRGMILWPLAQFLASFSNMSGWRKKRWMQCSDDSVSENWLCARTLIHMMKITDVSASPVRVMKGFCIWQSHSKILNQTTKLSLYRGWKIELKQGITIAKYIR